MKKKKILTAMLLVLLAGCLMAFGFSIYKEQSNEGIVIQLYGNGPLSSYEKIEFADAKTMISEKQLQASLKQEIEKQTGLKVSDMLSDYLNIKFKARQGKIVVRASGEDARILEDIFAKAFTDGRVKASIYRAMKPIDEIRIEIQRIKNQIQNKDLTRSEMTQLEEQLEEKYKKIEEHKRGPLGSRYGRWLVLPRANQSR